MPRGWALSKRVAPLAISVLRSRAMGSAMARFLPANRSLGPARRLVEAGRIAGYCVDLAGSMTNPGASL